MPKIRSSADLRNNYNDISTFCHTYAEPVFITKNGKGDLAVMSIVREASGSPRRCSRRADPSVGRSQSRIGKTLGGLNALPNRHFPPGTSGY